MAPPLLPLRTNTTSPPRSPPPAAAATAAAAALQAAVGSFCAEVDAKLRSQGEKQDKMLERLQTLEQTVQDIVRSTVRSSTNPKPTKPSDNTVQQSCPSSLEQRLDRLDRLLTTALLPVTPVTPATLPSSCPCMQKRLHTHPLPDNHPSFTPTSPLGASSPSRLKRCARSSRRVSSRSSLPPPSPPPQQPPPSQKPPPSQQSPPSQRTHGVKRELAFVVDGGRHASPRSARPHIDGDAAEEVGDEKEEENRKKSKKRRTTRVRRGKILSPAREVPAPVLWKRQKPHSAFDGLTTPAEAVREVKAIKKRQLQSEWPSLRRKESAPVERPGTPKGYWDLSFDDTPTQSPPPMPHPPQ